jgi:DNA-binding response OmpR family regulator
MAKILFVEDDPMISEIYLRKFSAAGFEVVPAMTGKEVLRKVAEEGPFDLVLLDIVLPEMNGIEVLSELRTSGRYDPDLKVVMFSNLNEQEDRKKAIDLGANGFIPKTEYSPSRLVEEVRRFLSQFEEQRKNAARLGGGGALAVPEGARKKILLIEDEEVFSEMFGKRLEDEGYEVTCVSDGASGVRTAMERPFDLIITDMALPGMSGEDVIRKLKSEASTREVPIFLFSASIGGVEDLEAIGCEGAEKCFLKTRITPSELAREVNLALRRE